MVKKNIYLCLVGGTCQQFSIARIIQKFSDLAFRFISGGFFMSGSSHVLTMLNQIVGQNSNILNSNIHKPKSVSNDPTASTNDKEVFKKDWLYTLRDK
jgi:hypothetical protein